MKRNHGTIQRCQGAAVALVCTIVLLAAGRASAQTHTTGLSTTKTCPAIAPSGSSYNCGFTVTNADEQHAVANLVVTDAVNGGAPAAVSCLQGGSAVTALGPAGSGTESCGGTIPITAPINCTASNQFTGDQVAASGTDAAPPPSQFNGLPVSGGATNNTIIPPLDCSDNNSCTTDTCDPVIGCQYAQVDCNDNDACTTDSCDPATGCGHAALDCDDEDACTTDTCDPTSGCQHSTITCADPVCTSCNPQTGSCDPLPELPAQCVQLPGRMTGGGSVFTTLGNRVTHGFELHCDAEVGPNNLEINWLKGQNFHLESLTSATCTDDPNIAPPPPQAGFDTYVGTGVGRCNGVSGATITFTLTDAGEPGKEDTATFEITGCPGGLTLSVSGNLKKGNHQAHAH